ncbi:MAG: methyltransferase [Acidimicrobiaceae bacterium]|nr:methyltransferase [Acidimicrobiaceae bacterium]
MPRHAWGAELLPQNGRAVDLGTGSGAIACVLLGRRPGASVLGTERDLVAARCARQNGVIVVEGDLFEGAPASWKGTVDVIITVLLHVPTGEIAYLPRDAVACSSRSGAINPTRSPRSSGARASTRSVPFATPTAIREARGHRDRAERLSRYETVAGT